MSPSLYFTERQNEGKNETTKAIDSVFLLMMMALLRLFLGVK